MKVHRFVGFMVALFWSANISASMVVLNITFDEYPKETAFGLWASEDAPAVTAYLDDPTLTLSGVAYDVASSSPIGPGTGYVVPGDFGGESPGPWTFVWLVDPGQYSFILSDVFGDGLCCEWGMGFFDLSVDGNLVVAGSAFTNFVAADFEANIPIPLPAPLLLLGSALVVLMGWRR